ncbi:isoleucine--tRNA ligase [Pedosphaera parvula]|uniref:Isoleucine--tRNA ligase n=1 Tax=Pedosphaera parvula (strain Ellin514) TaxID=320771 RepID=B9XPZ7_PEDPL|nr:isoleucine--tRNA ligase [Pedosphaera parvula]EEF58094.1 isoleucyl-tRNA synthetase [Pedosphaera parvula Ellin514]
MDYKNTLNLPQTDFPMKADLVTREPQRLEQWQANGLYEKIQAQRAGAEKFVLHDGPPFANGDVHIGTALNKILKDIIIKYQTLRGKSAPYVPGWDCHGLPIEFKVSQEMRKAGDTAADAATIRKACEAYARKYIDLQRVQFKRLGVLGDWDNPYLTLNKEYEADELRMFADIVEKGFVYRGKKPVYWSIPCRTALAEAEVEYHDHVSQSTYVKFPIVGRPNTYILIWTTTPWTLPANLAVAYNSTFSYSHVRVGDETYVLSTMLLPTVSEKCGWAGYEIIRSLTGEHLKEVEYQHPFCNRTGKLFAGDNFVENSVGTGFVHIAPGHGLDDYNLGRQNGLPIYSPVDDDGCLAYTNDLPREQQMPAEMVGKSILEKHGKSDANEAVLHELRLRKALLHQENYHHSYPFCWRSKTAIIFRAMDQWFISIDHNKFRDQALDSINHVKWVPDWGKNRIEGAVKSRPDWCISRQRTWGVPIPAFYDAQGNAILDAKIVRNAADLIEEYGSNVWFEKSPTDLWSLVKPKDWKGADAVTKSNDTLDVWIDSGSSSRSVLMRRPELHHDEKPGVDRWQADVYLEGSDQHRGWFQSSLLLSLAGNSVPPFKTVLTHGFMVDADREKISKSKQGQGGYEKPQTAEAYVKKYGADVVRLWVASQDYRNDIVVSEERVNKVSETYRGIRNTLRYQLSNLYDFDPAKHTVADDKLTGLDRWILGEFSKLEKEVLAAYANYEFHVVYQKVSQFVAVELSSIYHDVVKDRLYTDAANSQRRRSTQTALYRLVTGLSHILAPMLVFTTDEAWEFIPAKPAASVHLSNWTPASFTLPEKEQLTWKTLFELREQVLPELEKARQAKTIGKALDAKLNLSGTNPSLAEARSHAEALRELLNVSQLEIKTEGDQPITAVVAKADGQKCERCWHWETDIGSSPEHPTICARCVIAVKESLAKK